MQNNFTMKNLFILILTFAFYFTCSSQNVPVPAPEQSKTILVKNATIHVGNGTVLEQADMVFEQGKITQIGTSINAPENATEIDCSGKHVYPGIIALNTLIGLSEIDALRQTRDFREVGKLNPNVRAISAYNTDSRVTPTLRSNGILMAQIAPEGNLLRGSSSVVQLDAWNYEDAAYKVDDGIYLNWPNGFRNTGWWAEPGDIERQKKYKEEINQLTSYFQQAKAYFEENNKRKNANLRFEQMSGLFSGERKLYIEVDRAKEMIEAVLFAEKFGLKPVLVGASESDQIIPFLKQHHIQLVLNYVHETPNYSDDPIFQPYELPGILAKNNIEFALSIFDYWPVRNLPFQAGTAVAYGLDYEKAIESISLQPAKILGIEGTTGSLEVGKDATFLICNGDLLDMKSSNISQAFIQGRAINLGNKQKDLYIKFSEKYGVDVKMP